MMLEGSCRVRNEPRKEEAGKRGAFHEADDSESFQRGLKTRREVLGDEYVQASLNKVTDFSWPMQKLVTEYCWDAIRNRPGLSRRDRSILNLGMISVLNRQHELLVRMTRRAEQRPEKRRDH